MTTRVLLAAATSRGYSADQIEQGLTLGELLEQLEDAVEQFGPDALVVLDQGQRYGAGYGFLHADPIRRVGECAYCGEADHAAEDCPDLE